jgi:hypothetical protein
MENKLEWSLKPSVMAYVCQEGMKKTSKDLRLAGVPTENFPNASLQCYRQASLLGSSLSSYS